MLMTNGAAFGHASHSRDGNVGLKFCKLVGRSTAFMVSSTTIGWITIRFCSDIHGPKRIDCNNFGNSLTFELAPSSDKYFNVNYFVNVLKC